MASYTIAPGDTDLIEAKKDNDILLKAIRDSVTFPVSAQLQAYEPSREEITSRLKYLTENFYSKTDHRARTWGYTIIRTAYRDDNDEKFRHVVDTMVRFLWLWSDGEITRANEQMRRSRLKYEMRFYWPNGMPETANETANEIFLGRFGNNVVEDKEALNGATIPQASSAVSLL